QSERDTADARVRVDDPIGGTHLEPARDRGIGERRDGAVRLKERAGRKPQADHAALERDLILDRSVAVEDSLAAGGREEHVAARAVLVLDHAQDLRAGGTETAGQPGAV